jgi:hypothetical protein
MGSSSTTVAGASVSAAKDSSSAIAGGASASAGDKSSALGAGVASAGTGSKTEFKGAGVASKGSVTGGSTTALGVKSSGDSKDQSGRARSQSATDAGTSDAGVRPQDSGDAGASVGAPGQGGQGGSDAGVTVQQGDAGVGGGGGNVLLPPAPDTPEFRAAMSEAQRVETALGSASGAQADLVRWAASRKPGGVLKVPSAAWVENFLAVTKDLTPEQVERLKQVEWEPATEMSADEMRGRIDAALAGGTPTDEAPAADAITDPAGEKKPDPDASTKDKGDAGKAKAPDDKKTGAAKAPASGDVTTEAKLLAALRKKVHDFDYSALGDHPWWIAGEVKSGARTVIFYKWQGVAYGADVTIGAVSHKGGNTYVTISDSTFVVRQSDGVVFDSRLGGVRLTGSVQKGAAR